MDPLQKCERSSFENSSTHSKQGQKLCLPSDQTHVKNLQEQQQQQQRTTKQEAKQQVEEWKRWELIIYWILLLLYVYYLIETIFVKRMSQKHGINMYLVVVYAKKCISHWTWHLLSVKKACFPRKG